MVIKKPNTRPLGLSWPTKLQKSICYFDNCILSPELQLLTRNSPLWQPATAIQHTWSTGAAEVATRAGKFA